MDKDTLKSAVKNYLEIDKLEISDLVKILQEGAQCNKFTKMKEENFYNLAEALEIDFDGT